MLSVPVPEDSKTLRTELETSNTSTVDREVPPACFSSLSTLEPLFVLELCFSFHDDLQDLKNITVKKRKKEKIKGDKGNEKKGPARRGRQ